MAQQVLSSTGAVRETGADASVASVIERQYSLISIASSTTANVYTKRRFAILELV